MTEVAPQLTPSQTSGPYLEIGLIDGLIGSSLVQSDDPRSIRIQGRLLDGAGAPVPDGMVEIWQANESGRYAHPADTREDLPLDDGFTGFGRSRTNEDGSFEFVTIKPGRVPMPDGRLQAPHIVVGVFGRGLLKRLATRLYFPGDPANESDPILSRLDPAERETLIAAVEQGSPSSQVPGSSQAPAVESLRFDIRLQGEQQTAFFAV